MPNESVDDISLLDLADGNKYDEERAATWKVALDHAAEEDAELPWTQ